MSKDLEREYRALVNSEVPDLWARIEAGLEDKAAAPGDAMTDLHITDFSVTASEMKTVRDRRVNYRVWAGVAAACVCAALVVPALVRNVGVGSSDGFGSLARNFTVQNDASKADSYEAANNAGQAEAACEEAGNAGQAEAVCEVADNAGQEEAVCEEAFGAATTEYNSEKGVVTSDSAHNAANSDRDMAGGMQSAEATAEESDSFRATVEILHVDHNMDSGVLYTARVLLTENPDMEVDSKIQILGSKAVSEDSGLLTVDCTYELLLCEVWPEAPGQEVTYLLVGE